MLVGNIYFIIVEELQLDIQQMLAPNARSFR